MGFVSDNFAGSSSTYVPAGMVGALVSSGLALPRGVAVDGAGNVYIADTFHNAIWEWTEASNTVSTLVSSGLDNPSGVAVDGPGNLFIADADNNRIRRIDTNGIITTIAGGGWAGRNDALLPTCRRVCDYRYGVVPVEDIGGPERICDPKLAFEFG